MRNGWRQQHSNNIKEGGEQVRIVVQPVEHGDSSCVDELLALDGIENICNDEEERNHGEMIVHDRNKHRNNGDGA